MKHQLSAFACAFGLTVVSASAQTPPVAPASARPQAPTPSAIPVAGNPNSTIIERVLVRVNGEILTQSQLTSRQIAMLRESDRPVTEETLESRLAEVTPDVLVRSVDDLLQVQHGRELGFTFSQAQFQTAIDNIKSRNKLDDQQLAEALRQEGLTMEELRQNLESQFFIQGVEQREIGPSMTITLEEQRQYYKRNPEKFMTPLTVTIRELLINVPTTTQSGKEVFSVADDNAAKARIEELRAKALAGEDFAAIVSASSDSGTRSGGGLIGPVNVDDLSPTLKEILAKLEPGGISEPLRTARGYQVFKLEQRSTPALRPFDEVRRDIEGGIRLERLEPERQKLLSRLRAQAVIEWKDDTLKQIYEKRVAELAKQ
jgi:peptidyl-prolyl cis-trans isomerase SurA